MTEDAAPTPRPPFTASLAAADAKLTDAEHRAYQAATNGLAHRLLFRPDGWRLWVARWGLWITGAVLALAGTLIAVLLDAARERHGGTVAVLLFAAFLAGAYAADRRQGRYERRWATARSDAAASGYGARRYALDEDGVLFDSEALRGLMPWAAFGRVETAGGLLLLHADRIAHVTAIPLRAFASPEDAARAAAFALGKVAAALGAREQAG